MSRPLVVPLGRQVSVLDLSPAGAPDPRALRGRIGLAGQDVPVGGAALTVWTACHGRSDAADPWGRDEAAATALGWGLPAADVEAGWAELAAVGLVVDLVDDEAGRRAFARRHTLHPLVPGLGEAPDDPGVHRLGLPGDPEVARVQLSRPLRDVCAWGPLFADLWTGVGWHAAGYREAGVDEPRVTDPDLLLADLVASLPALLRTRSAHLDLAVTP